MYQLDIFVSPHGLNKNSLLTTNLLNLTLKLNISRSGSFTYYVISGEELGDGEGGSSIQKLVPLDKHELLLEGYNFNTHFHGLAKKTVVE